MISAQGTNQRAPGALLLTPQFAIKLYEGPIPSLIGCTVILVATKITPFYVFVNESGIGRVFVKYKAHNVKVLGKLKRDFKPIHKLRGEFEVEREVLGLEGKLPLTPEELELISELSEFRDVERDLIELGATAKVEEEPEDYPDKFNEDDLDEDEEAEEADTIPDPVPEIVAVQIAEEPTSFNAFWEAYGNKKDFSRASQKWDELTTQEKVLVMADVPFYLASLTNRMFQKSPAAYLTGRSWNS